MAPRKRNFEEVENLPFSEQLHKKPKVYSQVPIVGVSRESVLQSRSVKVPTSIGSRAHHPEPLDVNIEQLNHNTFPQLNPTDGNIPYEHGESIEGHQEEPHDAFHAPHGQMHPDGAHNQQLAPAQIPGPDASLEDFPGMDPAAVPAGMQTGIPLQTPAPAPAPALAPPPTTAPAPCPFPTFVNQFTDLNAARKWRRNKTRRAPYKLPSTDPSIAEIEGDWLKVVRLFYQGMTDQSDVKDNHSGKGWEHFFKTAYFRAEEIQAACHELLHETLALCKEGFFLMDKDLDLTLDKKGRPGSKPDRELSCADRVLKVYFALKKEKTICNEILTGEPGDKLIKQFVNAPVGWRRRKEANRQNNGRRGKEKVLKVRGKYVEPNMDTELGEAAALGIQSFAQYIGFPNQAQTSSLPPPPTAPALQSVGNHGSRASLTAPLTHTLGLSTGPVADTATSSAPNGRTGKRRRVESSSVPNATGAVPPTSRNTPIAPSGLVSTATSGPTQDLPAPPVQARGPRKPRADKSSAPKNTGTSGQNATGGTTQPTLPTPQEMDIQVGPGGAQPLEPFAQSSSFVQEMDRQYRPLQTSSPAISPGSHPRNFEQEMGSYHPSPPTLSFPTIPAADAGTNGVWTGAPGSLGAENLTSNPLELYTNPQDAGYGHENTADNWRYWGNFGSVSDNLESLITFDFGTPQARPDDILPYGNLGLNSLHNTPHPPPRSQSGGPPYGTLGLDSPSNNPQPPSRSPVAYETDAQAASKPFDQEEEEEEL